MTLIYGVYVETGPGWRTFLFTAILYFVAFVSPNEGVAQDYGEPYALKLGVYALDPTYDRGFRISAYLPHSTLVFPVPGKERNFSNFTASLVVTQLGQRVYVPKGEIAGKFSIVYGRQQLIFHSDSSLCPMNDSDCDDDSSIPVSRGDVAQIVNENKDGYAHLRLYKTPTREGLIKVGDLKRYLAQGWITDTRVRYPILERIQHIVVSSMSTECGQTRRQISEKDVRGEVGAELSVSAVVKVFFGFGAHAKMSASTGKSWELTEEFGSKEYAHQISILRIRNLVENRNEVYFVGAKYACVKVGFQRQKIFVTELSLFDQEGTLRGLFDFKQIYGWEGTPSARSKPYKIFSLNGRRPFFTSVNSHGEYWRIFQKFYADLQNVGLSAILLSEFNASCPRRKQSDGTFIPKLCRQYLRAK